MKFKNIAFLFPGQGAQQVGMGKDFYEAFTEARDVFEEGEALLKTPIKKLIFEGPDEVLKETKNSQTAIYLTSLALCQVLKKQFPSLQPKATAGLSLGEYTALTAAEKILFSSCLPLVHFRGACMHEACEKTVGGMAAILGLPSQEVKLIAESLKGELWVANYNSADQTVISGTMAGIEKGIALAKEKGAKRAIPLKVHGAFHSGLMKSAEEKLKTRLEEVTFFDSPIDVLMNVTGNYVSNPSEIRKLLESQVTQSVLWENIILQLKPKIDLFIEIGPGKTLAGLNKQMGITVPTISINKVEDLETLNKVLNE